MRTKQHTQLFINGLSILKMVIDDLTVKLCKLKNSENFKHKQYKLEKTKELIGNLYDVYDSFTFLKKYGVWREVEKEMQQMDSKDNQLSGFVIVIRTRLQGNQLGLIDKYTGYGNI